MKKHLSHLALAVSILFSGCASIINGSHQDIPIVSDPPGAAVLVDGTRVGETPTNLHLARKTPHLVTVKMEGYETENVQVTHSLSGAVAGNIVAGGLIGWGVDASTGAQYKLHPESISLKLRPIQKPIPQGLTVDDLMGELKHLDMLKAQGAITPAEYQRLRALTLQKFGGTP